MREITKLMYKRYALNKLRYDFMGYTFNRPSDLSFHHLILPRRLCKGQSEEGYYMCNGAILTQKTSHDYLHTIECYDQDMYDAITSEMIDENIKGRLDIENLKAIDDILNCFEREYCGKRTNKGHLLIKPQYVRERVFKR